jgi:signal transduction histidine kinase
MYDSTDVVVGVDADMVTCLFESLLDEAIKNTKPGKLLLRAADKGDTVCVELVDERVVLTSEEVADLFVPTEKNISDKGVSGMEYLVAKEVVRLHEDYTGKYGGRMEARSDVSGTVILFTLPK